MTCANTAGKQTCVCSQVLFLLFLIIGLGLIWLIYGGGAAILGLLCVLAAMIPIALIVLILWLAEWMLKRADHG